MGLETPPQMSKKGLRSGNMVCVEYLLAFVWSAWNSIQKATYRQACTVRRKMFSHHDRS